MRDWTRVGDTVRSFRDHDRAKPSTPAQRAVLQESLAQHLALLSAHGDANVRGSVVLSIVVSYCMACPEPLGAVTSLFAIVADEVMDLLSQHAGRA